MTSEPLLRPSVRGPARGTRSPGSVSGACRPVPRSPRPPPLAPSAPHPLARACSPASQLLRQGLTSPARASPASAHRLPDADHTATGLWSSGRSPGSRARSVRTCQGLRPRGAGRLLALTQATVWPSASQTASALRSKAFAAQWLAYTIPCRRFAPGLATENARLGADAVRYSFIAVDFHHLLLAGLPAHPTPFLGPLRCYDIQWIGFDPFLRFPGTCDVFRSFGRIYWHRASDGNRDLPRRSK